MDKQTIRVGDEILLSGRKAVIVKMRGRKLNVRPYGESSRWVSIEDCAKIDQAERADKTDGV